jgi:hypothetical protein
MGPKNSGDSKKTVEKKKERILEDKTFGLKNKNKSKVVQNYIKGVEAVIKGTVKSQADVQKEFAEKAEKKKAKQEEAFLSSLYKTVKTVKQEELEEGELAKNVICAFFKAGCCEKGDECEFSHDLNLQYNQGTFDIYTDLREAKKDLGLGSELNKIAEEKEKKRSKMPQSNIVCKFFLEAVQKRVYGWKWECPNGDECHYKHCLPKGYVITTRQDKIQEEMTLDEFYHLEEQIDAERDRISKIGTKVTDQTFADWKKRRDEFRKNKKEDELKAKMKSGLSGIQLFKGGKLEFKDDDNAADVEEVREDNQEEELNKDGVGRTEKEIMEDLENDMKGIKINAELFGEENLDELNDIVDDEELNENEINKNGENNGMMKIEEEEKEYDNK